LVTRGTWLDDRPRCASRRGQCSDPRHLRLPTEQSDGPDPLAGRGRRDRSGRRPSRYVDPRGRGLSRRGAIGRREPDVQRTRRARFVVNDRGPMLGDWAGGRSRELHWTAPAAGAICFFSYKYPIDSMALVDRLIREYSTMIVPGIHFRAERHLRIGFGMVPRVL